MISLENVSFRYPGQVSSIFDHLSIQFPPKKISVILGPNGCGKSTLFHLAFGWIKPEKGVVKLGNYPIWNLSRQQIGRKLAILPQFEKAPFQLTTLDYILLGRTPYQNTFALPSREDLKTSVTAMDVLEISHLSNKLVSQLSGGEQQLVFIARVLTQSTPVILLDEITTHLDLRHIKIIFSLLKNLKTQGKTIIMTMHDPNLSAAIADEIILLFPDSTYMQGKPNEMMTSENLSRIYGLSIPLCSKENDFMIDWNKLLAM